MKKLLVLLLILFVIVGVILFLNMKAEEKKLSMESVPEVTPINHASMVLNWDGKIVYTDPVGADAFAGQPEPDVILITDIHGDHFDPEALKLLAKDTTIIIAPMAVADQMPEAVPGTLLVMNNGQKAEAAGLGVEAVPMYNLPEAENASYHTKGRGNGYVVEAKGTRVYISGDTAGTPEMRNLKDIDIAFVAMNLPYTMGVEEAADAVLAFKPKKVYPYHFRTEDGFSDIAKFRELVHTGNPGIEVVELDWY